VVSNELLDIHITISLCLVQKIVPHCSAATASTATSFITLRWQPFALELAGLRIA